MKSFIAQISNIVQRVLLAFVIAGCITPVDLSIDKQLGLGTVVINGQISTLAEGSYVDVGRTSFEDRLPIPESGAAVIVTDEMGATFHFNERPLKQGRYEMQVGSSGSIGHTYTLQVTLLNGEIYKSKTETIPSAVGTDEIDYSFVEEEFIDFEGTLSKDAFIKIYSKPSLPNVKPYLCRWSVEEVYQIKPTDFPDPFGNTPPDCFVTQNPNPQQIKLFDGRQFSNQLTSDVLLVSRQVDQTFQYKHYFTIYQSAISQASYDYWEKVSVLASQTGSIFDTPPAELTGNIFNPNDRTEKVYGYFQATAQTMTRMYIIQADLPQFAWLGPYCDYMPSKPTSLDYPEICRNCINYPNSSYVRPDWF
jgi:Domain of unknown function (DUF4249)